MHMKRLRQKLYMSRSVSLLPRLFQQLAWTVRGTQRTGGAVFARQPCYHIPHLQDVGQ
jgi:hypothetical protein